MDVNQFQEFLNQLVSLQAQGLDAQHLIDEAKKAGKEEALKNIPAPSPVPVPEPVPVEGEAPAVDVEALKAHIAELEAVVVKVTADDASDKEKIEAAEAREKNFLGVISKMKEVIAAFEPPVAPAPEAPAEV